MEQSELIISFEDTSLAEANILAEDLRKTLITTHPDVSVKRVRKEQDTMDFGSILAIILGTKAVIAVAEGLGAWLKQHQRASIRIERPDGTIVAENITSRQALELAKLLTTDRQP